tara:strand:+ start:218 stop:550 length:333 start_codon:yes stop_codon:yes gene_type:complete
MNNKELNYNRESHLRWYNENGKKYYKEYYQLNKDKVREYQKTYYQKNRDYIRKRQKTYHHENYYSKYQSYFKEHYLQKRQEVLDKQAYQKAYGNGIVKFNNEEKFIISFK